MEKHIYDEKNGLWYELQGNYFVPCLKLPAEEQRPIGIWGQRHLRYLRQHRKALYTELLTSGKLNGYLADLNEQAESVFLELISRWRPVKASQNNLRSRIKCCGARVSGGDLCRRQKRRPRRQPRPANE